MKILYVTTIGGTMNFFKSFIKGLLDEGHTVDIATNETTSPVAECYREWGCRVFPISTSRSPLKWGNVKAIGEIRRLVLAEGYDIVHCHTPIAAVCTRLACKKARKKGTRVIYTAHGFHFYKGAPRKNWMIYYTAEKLCARHTDVLITINREDYDLAQRKLKAKRVEYVPGVGVDVERFRSARADRNAKREELGIPADAFLAVSVGELNQNKNHETVLRALAECGVERIHYAVAGVGNKREELLALAESLGVGDRFHLLGYRSDVAEIYHAADACVFPSIREGLGLAAIEGMACSLPLIVSDNRGTRDYSENGENALVCSWNSVTEFAAALRMLEGDGALCRRMGEKNVEIAPKFDQAVAMRKMREIYEKGAKEHVQ